MGTSPTEASSGPYLLKAEACPTSPILFKSILESWCNINCSGGWKASIHIPNGDGNVPEGIRLELDAVDDLMLFMMSVEYTHMGYPHPDTISPLRQ